MIFEKSATGARSFVSDTSEHAPVRVTHDATSGAHGVAYNLPVADAYVVRVFFRDAELFDAAPKTATISAGPAEAATTIAAGVGLQRAVVGEEASFVVYVSDRYGNVLTAPEPGLVLAATASVVVDGGDRLCESGKVTALDASAVALAWDAVAGRYEGTYTPAIAGLVSVRLSMSGGSGGMGAVAGSPFAARAAPGATSGGVRRPRRGPSRRDRRRRWDGSNHRARRERERASHGRGRRARARGGHRGRRGGAADDGDGYRRRDVPVSEWSQRRRPTRTNSRCSSAENTWRDHRTRFARWLSRGRCRPRTPARSGRGYASPSRARSRPLSSTPPAPTGWASAPAAPRSSSRSRPRSVPEPRSP